MSYEITLGIDCAPGKVRPKHIAQMIASECGLEVALGRPLFGAATGVVKKRYEAKEDAELDANRIWRLLGGFYESGMIRGAFKEIADVPPGSVSGKKARGAAGSGSRRKRHASPAGEMICDRCGRSFAFGYTILGVMAGKVENVCADCTTTARRNPFLRLVEDGDEGE
jgi:hypothetical protein